MSEEQGQSKPKPIEVSRLQQQTEKWKTMCIRLQDDNKRLMAEVERLKMQLAEIKANPGKAYKACDSLIEQLAAKDDEIKWLKKHIAKCMIYRLSALGCRCGYMSRS